MRLFAFSDFHLSGDPPTKPMDIFGEIWANHREKIRRAWLDVITEDDACILAGDLSWGNNLEEAMVDLDWIAALPGRKIIVRGNHDYWWDTVTKMTRETGGAFEFLHNNVIHVGKWALVGTRGWLPETASNFTGNDRAILLREEGRMQRAIEMAKKEGASQIMAVLHYPPYDDAHRPTHMLEIVRNAGIPVCVFGHIHGKQNFRDLPERLLGVRLYLTSADYLDFKPQLLCEDVDHELQIGRRPPALGLHLRRQSYRRIRLFSGK